jgi:excisionase family DNA binding protein
MEALLGAVGKERGRQMSEPKDLTITEAAKVLGLSRWTVKSYVHSGHLPSRLALKGRMNVRYIRHDDLVTFRENHLEKPGEPGAPGLSAQCGQSRAKKDEETQVTLAYLVKAATTGEAHMKAEIESLRQEVQELRQQIREYETLPWVPQYRRIAKRARLI